MSDLVLPQPWSFSVDLPDYQKRRTAQQVRNWGILLRRLLCEHVLWLLRTHSRRKGGWNTYQTSGYRVPNGTSDGAASISRPWLLKLVISVFIVLYLIIVLSFVLDWWRRIYTHVWLFHKRSSGDQEDSTCTVAWLLKLWWSLQNFSRHLNRYF